LHIDSRTGSIKVGKDADLVLWNNNPLSIYAVAEKTFVDGALMYDKELSANAQQAMRAERERLIAKMLDSKKSGATTEKPKAKVNKVMHCDD
jgi:urease alpha subunit